MTNIALKGIIGVKAMAEIAHAVGEDADAKQYGVSNAFVSQGGGLNESCV